MSNEMAIAGVLAREDCSSCQETGARCALHQSMYLRAMERQQEAGTIVQTQQAHDHERGGRDGQQPSERSEMSRRATKEMNRAKTQEGQMISALRRMNFDDSKQQHDLTKKQKKRDRKQEKVALHVPDPAKIAKRQEKAAQRAADPERIARMEARRQNMAESKARTKARRVRLVDQHKQQGKPSTPREIAEANDELQRVSNEYISSGPASRTRGQNAARDVHAKLQDLATVHSMPAETGTDAFLTRADSLIDQTLASNSVLSTNDRKNLEEALSLIRTVQLLSAKDYRPSQIDMSEGLMDRVIRGPAPEEHVACKRELVMEEISIKQENASENDAITQENTRGFYGQLRGGNSPVSGLSQTGGAERDAMVE